MKIFFCCCGHPHDHNRDLRPEYENHQHQGFLLERETQSEYRRLQQGFPVTRTIPRTTAVAKAALEEMFKGVTKEEEAKGYGSIPTAESNGIRKSINVKNGAAYVNFTNRVLEQMGTATTSCGGGQYFGMIEKTLTQFPSIKKVYYAVEGNTNEFYEWVQVGECPHGRHCRKSNFE